MYMGTGDFTHGMTEFAISDAVKKLDWLQRDQIEMCSLTESPEQIDSRAFNYEITDPHVRALFELDRLFPE